MTKFVTMDFVNGKLVETGSFEISAKAMDACPHAIFVGEHYNRDGTCKCYDPNDKNMKEWGYTWRDGRWRGDYEDKD